MEKYDKGTMEIIFNRRKVSADSRYRELFTVDEAEKARSFHKTVPGYETTPLAELKDMARFSGVETIYIKDESPRFGLNAFKGLGGSYCVAKCLTEIYGSDKEDLTYDRLLSVGKDHEKLTFITATDGNHGRGIAWITGLMGHSGVVYMPSGSSKERLENIRKLGAEASITDMNYDDTVRFAAGQAEKNGWIFVQDTAWEGYEKTPAHIMQGYMTMGAEIAAQIPEEKAPTHIFLQAGVGAMAGAMTGFFRELYKDRKVKIIIVEPDKADCIFRTAKAADGRLRRVRGSLDTIMAGLACGEPCSIGWDILSRGADAFISMSDHIAARGMRILACPIGSDSRVISGESGAAGFGALMWILQSPQMKDFKEKLGLGKDSRILCISTEGATDVNDYRRIVWDGLYPSF